MASFTPLPGQQGQAASFHQFGQTLASLIQAAQQHHDYLAQQGKENAFKQQQLDIEKGRAGLASQEWQDTHAANQARLEGAQNELQQSRIARAVNSADIGSVQKQFETDDGQLGVPRTITHEVPNAGVGPAQPVPGVGALRRV